MPEAWEEAAKRSGDGARLQPAQGLALLRDAPLSALGCLAARTRHHLHPQREVTYAIDTNPNYSNICVTDCAFCAFYRKPGDPEGYVLTVDQVMEKIASAVGLGATTVLLQGGHNPGLPFAYYLSLVRETRRRFPGVTPHFFTCSEIEQMAAVSSLSTRRVLEELRRAGQFTLPGGGAEILSDRVRRRLAPKKGPSSAWIRVMREAHQVGMRSTATMMYGHLEEDEDILEHLEQVRALQDETGGFTAFIPWSFKKGNTPLETRLEARGFRPAGAARYLRMLALARVYLDNVPHLQASWFGEGKKTGQIALHFGADDFGGTLIEENVHLATGHDLKTTVEEVKTLIREAGFTPVQRTTLYQRIDGRSPAPAAPAT